MMTHLPQLISDRFRNSFFEEYFRFTGGRTGILGIVGVVRERGRDAESGSIEGGLGVIISMKPFRNHQFHPSIRARGEGLTCS